MKKILALLLAGIMALALVACGPTTPNDNQQGQNPPQGSNGDNGTNPGGDTTPTSVDYTGDISDWMYAPEQYDDDITTSLVNIDSTPYGTPGSSMQGLVSGYHALQLAGQDDLSAVEAYLDGMNDTQRDYFSFQWQQAMATARNILSDTDTYTESLRDAGVEDVDLSLFNLDRLNALNTTVTGYLTSRGVTDAWKSHSTTEPFSLVG